MTVCVWGVVRGAGAFYCLQTRDARETVPYGGIMRYTVIGAATCRQKCITDAQRAHPYGVFMALRMM